MKKKSKRPPQHIIHALGVSVAVTLDTWAEENRVRAKAKRLGVSVDDLIVDAIYRTVRRPSNRGRGGVLDVIARAIQSARSATQEPAYVLTS